MKTKTKWGKLKITETNFTTGIERAIRSTAAATIPTHRTVYEYGVHVCLLACAANKLPPAYENSIPVTIVCCCTCLITFYNFLLHLLLFFSFIF